MLDALLFAVLLWGLLNNSGSRPSGPTLNKEAFRDKPEHKKPWPVQKKKKGPFKK